MNNKKSNYILAALWFVASLFISVANDIITKQLGFELHSFEIVFLRFLFGTIVLLPFIIMQGKSSIKTSHKFIHLTRGLLLFCGIWIWTYCLNKVNVSTATVINFTIPIFVLILAKFILKESLTLSKTIATIIGFSGVFIIAYQPDNIDINALLLLGASFMFALLDVINKKYVVQESIMAMMFYSNLVIILASLPLAINHWIMPTDSQFILFLMLGAGANLLLYCLLKAFSLANASELVPLRYLELVISGAMAYIFFGEKLLESVIIGSMLIIPSTLFISYIASKGGKRASN